MYSGNHVTINASQIFMLHTWQVLYVNYISIKWGGGVESGGGGREGYLSNSDLNGAVANRKWLGALHHQSQGKGM